MTHWRRIAFSFSLMSIIVSMAQGSASAQPAEKGVLGLGLILGEPTGVSAKLYLSDDTAVDAAVGGAFVNGGLQVHADYLWHPWVLEQRASFVLPAYLGAGLRVLDHANGADGDFHIGLRAVGGILFDFKDVPIDVFVEVAAVFDYVIDDDDTHKGLAIDVNGGAGVRYYF